LLLMAVMAVISFHASHEQFAPSELLALVRHAETSGFDAAFSSDHLHPWAARQGQAGFSWAWMGAALEATTKLPFGSITVPGGWRYHPAIVAQAFATLGQMYPGRIPWVALGSGEAINERVIGQGWPDKEQRDRRLEEAAAIMRKLFAGERVTTRGLIACENAQLWSRPTQPIQLVGAAMSEATAERVGRWADGLLTNGRDLDELRKIAGAFQRTAPGKPMYLKVDLSWAPSEEQALANAYDQWRFLAVGREAAETLESVEAFEEAAREVTPEDMRKTVLISSDLDRHIEWLRERAGLGFQMLDLHNVGRNQREFIDAFSRRVLSAIRSAK
jgi:coenzyme F420-dependent glucose-6-phosphate dehydrogenase